MKATTSKIRSFLALSAPLLQAMSASAATAQELKRSCDYDTYMCCWSGKTDNTDVCRVPNSSLMRGDILEMPNDSEGSVNCHGFGWYQDDSDDTITDLLEHVTALGYGYSGVEGAEAACGCLEDMPVVSTSDCSRMKNGEISRCPNDDLRAYYNRKLDKPNGEMDINLVKECDNYDVPEFDFGECGYNTYMCCWTENDGYADGYGMGVNTEVCTVEPGVDAHCHGFVWPDGASDRFIHLHAQQVQHFNHRDKKGYSGNIRGAPQCGCIEDMPVVSRADCAHLVNDDMEEGKFLACQGNDLERRYRDLTGEADFPPSINLVDDCQNWH